MHPLVYRTDICSDYDKNIYLVTKIDNLIVATHTS